MNLQIILKSEELNIINKSNNQTELQKENQLLKEENEKLKAEIAKLKAKQIEPVKKN